MSQKLPPEEITALARQMAGLAEKDVQQGRAAVARLAHNQKVAGSTPAPATKSPFRAFLDRWFASPRPRQPRLRGTPEGYVVLDEDAAFKADLYAKVEWRLYGGRAAGAMSSSVLPYRSPSVAVLEAAPDPSPHVPPGPAGVVE